MLKCQQSSMQSLPGETADKALYWLFQPVDFRLEAGAIIIVAKQWMANMGHVDPDLMSSACLESAFHE